MAEISPVLKRRDDKVQILVICNPGKRNATNVRFYTALSEALTTAAAEKEIGAVVLTGADGFFSAGGELQQLVNYRPFSADARRQRVDALHDLVRLMRDFPKPLVAAVEGGAAGAGFSLALACDLLVAATDAFFAVAHVKVGLTPDGGITSFLAQNLSRQLLMQLCLTGNRITAPQLHAWGMVNELTEPGGAEAAGVALAARLAKGPPEAMTRIKALCRGAAEQRLDFQLAAEADAMVAAQASSESVEGIAAFFARRPPVF